MIRRARPLSTGINTLPSPHQVVNNHICFKYDQFQSDYLNFKYTNESTFKQLTKIFHTPRCDRIIRQNHHILYRESISLKLQNHRTHLLTNCFMRSWLI